MTECVGLSMVISITESNLSVQKAMNERKKTCQPGYLPCVYYK